MASLRTGTCAIRCDDGFYRDPIVNGGIGGRSWIFFFPGIIGTGTGKNQNDWDQVFHSGQT
jgi:hypothetical protein